MKWNRRELVKFGGVSALQGLLASVPGCNSGKPLPRLLRSNVPLPKKFEAELPRLSVLKPTVTSGVEDRYELRACVSTAKILSDQRTAIWGFDGMFPGPTIEVRSGRQATVAIANDLPVPLVTHVHGGRTPPASDGYPTDLVLPKQGWPAMHMHDPMANIVSGTRNYTFPNAQRAATLWYHDHRMDFTGPQLWKGLAGFYIVRDDEEKLLPLPAGDREVALMICDRSFDADGSFLYPSIQPSLTDRPGVQHEFMGGVLGDVMLVNGAAWPRLYVSNTRYRFRILNASNARHLELALEPGPRLGPVFCQIGSDGGLLERPVIHSRLPIAPAERFDVVIDFSQFAVGDNIVLRNTHASGDLASVMRFDVVRQEADHSSIPERLCNFETLDQKDATTTRFFDFSYGGMEKGWAINGQPFDPSRIDAHPPLNGTELWHFHSDRSHPLHLHLAHFQILAHGGRPRASDAGWKDTISMYAGQTSSVLVKFNGYRGRYVFHCHNLEHEDMAMMGNFEVT